MYPRKFAATHFEHPVVIMADDSQTLTYGQLETRANQGAHYIRSLGIANGDYIAIWLRNGVTFLGSSGRPKERDCITQFAT